MANQSMIDGTSITQEYELKNQSAGAVLEKAQKQVKALWIELGENLWPIMTTGLNIFSMFIKLLSSTISFVSNNFKAISTLTLTIVAYFTAVQIAAKWEAITTALMATKRVAMLAMNIVYGLLTGQITRAAVAQQLLNLRMLANPYGLVAAAIVGLTALIINYAGKLSAVERAQKAVNDTNQQALEDTVAQRFEIENLSKTIRDETKDRSLRLTAIKKLRDIMPDVLKDYTDEALMVGKATEAIQNYTQALLFESRIKAKKKHLDKIVEENEKYNAPREDGVLASIGKVVVGEQNYDYFTGRTTQQYEDRITDLNFALKDLMKTEEEYEKLKKKNNINIDPTDVPNSSIPTGGSSGTDKKAESARKKSYQKELDDAEKHHQAVLQEKGLFR
ncbi:MAG: hypothetical protein ACRDE7_11515, partial [Sphingobacterium sp.]